VGYAVKEIVYTLQGEGAHTGRAAVFCRFAGCNLWTGLEPDRSSALCRFCDTDFVGADGPGGGKFATAADLARAIAAAWTAPPAPRARPFVVFTGGEPLLQLDEDLLRHVHGLGFEAAVETNGTRLPPPGVDWICVSPKAGSELRLRSGDELKLVYPQDGAPPERFADLPFDHFFLQPMDGPERERNARLCVDYCLRHPPWRVSLQTHKLLAIP
jgi:7-carboxy-7-deazaguanine synthase